MAVDGQRMSWVCRLQTVPGSSVLRRSGPPGALGLTLVPCSLAQQPGACEVKPLGGFVRVFDQSLVLAGHPLPSPHLRFQ